MRFSGGLRGAAQLLVAAAVISGPRTALAQDDDPARDGGFRWEPVLWVQGDFRAFPGWDAQVANVRVARDEAELRRARVGVQARYRSFDLELDLDPTDDGAVLKDAFLERRFSKRLRLRAGHFKLPFTREQLTSAANTDFLERSVGSSSLAPGRDIGLLARTRLAKGWRLETGLFAGDGTSEDWRSGPTAAARLSGEPRDGVEIGLGVTWGTLSPREDGIAGGLAARAPSGYRFFAPHHVDGTRLRLAGEVEWTIGRARLSAGTVHGRESREGQGVGGDALPALTARSLAAGASWRILGDASRRRARKGTLEAGLRVEDVHLDDAGKATAFPSPGPRAADVRAADATVLTAGLSWWPADWVRLAGNATAERYDPAAIGPEPSRRDPYYGLAFRVQLRLPWAPRR